jgi:D-serine deaminase-like pyridoxal phosphate-dependent protein
MTLGEIETPALILDRAKLDRNLARMHQRITRLGAHLRPHVKTAKSVDVVRRAVTPAAHTNSGGITVSTLKEAEQFFAAGYRDILYAVGIAPNKLDHVAALRARGCDLTIILDSVDAARAVADKSRSVGAGLPTLIEIDSDGHRAGVKPGDARLIEIGRMLGANLRGVMTHAGGSYDCKSADDIRGYAQRERAEAVRCAEQLRAAGFPCPVVSVGSTPTATYAENLDGVTEVRVGVYMFFDLFMAGLGVCRIDNLALSVLCCVIGHQPEKGWIITDAGWMALSRDRGTAGQKVDQGYGVVCDVNGAPLNDLIVASANQEHGIIARRGGVTGEAIDHKQFPVGTLLRILPNHACATAAQHDGYHVVNEALQVEARWPRFSGW